MNHTIVTGPKKGLVQRQAREQAPGGNFVQRHFHRRTAKVMPLLHAVDAQDGRQRIQNHIKEILTPEQKAKLHQFSRQGMMGW
jgi:hypothetical protein